jgi:DNA-binding IclR family transcriptional regulator
VSQNNGAASESVSPQAQLIQMAWEHQASSLVRVAAQLKLADHLAEGPRTAEHLAEATATHAPSLYRLLRTMASMGLFTEDTERGR